MFTVRALVQHMTYAKRQCMHDRAASLAVDSARSALPALSVDQPLLGHDTSAQFTALGMCCSLLCHARH